MTDSLRLLDDQLEWSNAPCAAWTTRRPGIARLRGQSNVDSAAIDRPDPGDRWLSWESTSERRYRPLRDHPELFLLFAGLSGEAQYLSFAEEYGPLLGIETAELWEYESATMRSSIHLWQGLREGRPADALSDFTHAIRFTTAHRDWFVPTLKRDYDETRRVPDAAGTHLTLPEGLQRYHEEQRHLGAVRLDTPTREVAQIVLERTIDDALTRYRIAPVVRREQTAYGTGLRVSLAPRQLGGALWLQFALAVDGNRKYRVCPECGKWWDATDARSHKQVCSDKCRAAKSYRLRQAAMKAVKREEGSG
ncbi:MAG: hypothetical protein P4L93_08195 [Coriobacteriia bacterium]|nr:hypothetical protein [Coriobacteriia bacterium]